MEDPITMMQSEPFFLASYSALDSFFGIKEPGSFYINTEMSLIGLAKMFDTLRYPGLPFADAVVLSGEKQYWFRCVDNIKQAAPVPFTAMQLLYDSQRGVFIDQTGIYPCLRALQLTAADDSFPAEVMLMEAARMVARYHYTMPEAYHNPRNWKYPISIEEQRDLLIAVLSGKNTGNGLTLLRDNGFLACYWPELQCMVDVKQTKDFHPEGDVWNHTMETFQYRKKADLTLSLALLFHDIGKPVANETGTFERPFDGHAELGVKVAARFLNRLQFPQSVITDVCFLIKYHMLPFALPKLPPFRTEKVMDSPLFPLLLELYRADSSSSFIGPGGYYEACRVYRNYLRTKKNPYKKNIVRYLHCE